MTNVKVTPLMRRMQEQEQERAELQAIQAEPPTAAERARMEAISPELLAGLDGKGPKRAQSIAKTMLSHWRAAEYETARGGGPSTDSRPGERTAPEAAAAPAVIEPEVVESEEEVPKSRRAKAKSKGRKNVPVPTDVARCSFFFPLRNRDLEPRIYLENVPISFGHWGQACLSGPQMSTQDEDVLLALIAVMLECPEYVRTDIRADEEGRTFGADEKLQDGRDYYASLPDTFTYNGPILPIARKLGYERPNKKDYARIIRSLKLLAGCVIEEFEVADGKRGFRRVKLKHLLEKAEWDLVEQRLFVCLSPLLFRAMIADRGVKISLIDIQKRFVLRGEIAKALHRFLSSHSGSLLCHFSKLAEAINMDTGQPTFKQRQLLRTAIKELVEHGILAKDSGFVDTNNIHLIKAEKRKGIPSGKRA